MMLRPESMSRLWLAALVFAAPFSARAEQRVADVRQGTNLAIALSPDGQTLVADLLDQLWLLPAAGGAARPLTPTEEIARNPRFSSNGREIVYQQRSGDQWDLRVADVTTAASLALTASPFDEREPDFTADGRSVVFVSNQTGHDCLWRLDIATGVLTQLTEEPGNASFPSVSEIDEIAYVRELAGRYSLRTLAGDGAAAELISTPHALSAPSWRPGGGVLVFAEHDRIGAGTLKLLLQSDPLVIKPLAKGEDIFRSRASWASPGEFLYAADGQIWRRGIADVTRRPVHLFAAVAVESHPPPVSVPAVAPGAKQRALGVTSIARSADGRRTAFTALGDLWLVERGSAVRLTDDEFVEIDPAWSADGESLLFASDRSGTMSLWRATLGAHRTFTQLTFDDDKAYRPTPAPDGKRVAYLATDGLGPWAPSALRVLASGASRTIVEGLVNAGVPTWDAAGATVSVAAESETATVSIVRTFDAATGDEIYGMASPPDGASAVESAPGELKNTPEWRAAGSTEPYVVQIGRLFDGTGADYRRHVDMHIENGRVTAIVGRGSRPLPERIIDARDATVLPGLIDVHAHHSLLAGERLGRIWLAYGVTTVRELAADLPEALERGESWASGRRKGPRLVITPTANAMVPRGATAAAIPVRAYPSVADGFAHSLPRQAAELSIPDRSIAVRSPRFLRTPTGPHYELETSPLHASYQDSVSRVLASGTTTGSALGAAYGFGAEANDGPFITRDFAWRTLFTAAEQQHWSASGLVPEAAPALSRTIAQLIRAGGRVAIGSDAPAVPYGLGLHFELALLDEAGIPRDQALRLATAEGAIALGLEAETGTLENGKRADFVVLAGDPLARIADTLTIVAVAKDGVLYDRTELLAGP